MPELAVDLSKAALSGVASKVSESMFDSVRGPCVFKYQGYIEGMEKLVEGLINARERVEHFVDYYRIQGEEIGKDVEQWLIKVNECIGGERKCITVAEEKAKKWCFKSLCVNVIRRYLLSKKSMNAGKNAVNFLGKGAFDRVSYCYRRQRREYMYLEEPFDSGMSKCQDIMEALNDANINMIVVYGMGGVGKKLLII